MGREGPNIDQFLSVNWQEKFSKQGATLNKNDFIIEIQQYDQQNQQEQQDMQKILLKLQQQNQQPFQKQEEQKKETTEEQKIEELAEEISKSIIITSDIVDQEQEKELAKESDTKVNMKSQEPSSNIKHSISNDKPVKEKIECPNCHGLYIGIKIHRISCDKKFKNSQ